MSDLLRLAVRLPSTKLVEEGGSSVFASHGRLHWAACVCVCVCLSACVCVCLRAVTELGEGRRQGTQRDTGRSVRHWRKAGSSAAASQAPLGAVADDCATVVREE